MTDINPLSFTRYEDYLEAHITSTDMMYLGDLELARQLVELGVKAPSSGPVGAHGALHVQNKAIEVLTKEEFRERHESDARIRAERQTAPKIVIVSAGRDLSFSPFLAAIADREELCRIGKLSTIIFIRDTNPVGQEVSGYVDLTDRFQTDDFTDYFEGRKRFMPKPGDLSYYNWENGMVSTSDSPNFQVIQTDASGLKFKHKKDRKVVNVDPKESAGDNSRRFMLETEEYVQVVFFDHVTRRRN
eukprot:ANDGO_01536.mRNA.1 hypothetical protein SDRG_02539